MELRHLRYFVAVAEELHYGRAARRLYVAQPGLSQQIMAFEKELGTALFTRNRRGVALTDAGAALLPAARDILARAEAAVQMTRRYGAGEAGQLTISLTRSAPRGIVTELLDTFRAAHPAIEVRVTSGFTAHDEQRLRERSIDAALVRMLDDPRGDLADRTVGEEAIVAAVPSADPLARKRRVRRADVTDRPLVWWPREHGPRMWDRMLDEVFGEGVRPPVARWEPEEEHMLHAVAQGHGITFITEGRAAALHVPGIAVRRFTDPAPTVPITLAWSRDNPNPALHRFLEHTADDDT
ncbi:LysR substrate-binding domain-containing protein [Streptomyces sp. RY43-2]|uniref:LysR substrate-binding domain-containing protein n=1 Tax=Streptomyces macrolidinus TaxID=2952607 RepID=A0ABT0ZL89_9ACTN|nr:LysR substrate-binding domain-containing protein [Streptomyces macrolidinus]MCN9244336.1 LysR substrate-binding domain-containing protein [Streptomyces macrolidinus]